MQSHSEKPTGTITLPALLCALTGSVLAVGMDLMGHFAAVELWLHQVWLAEPFYLNEPIVVISYANWAISFVVSWLVALAVLDSANMWRRLLLGAFSFVLVLGAAPCLVLWNVEWMPMVTVLSLMWSWCCALVYASQHQMPCDSKSKTAVRAGVELKVETIEVPNKKKVSHAES
jgi:hypothetical protein